LSRDAAQSVGAAVLELEARSGDEVLDCAGGEDFAWCGDRLDTLAEVDGQTCDVAVEHFYLAGMHSGDSIRRTPASVIDSATSAHP
jgi:hypothetical protein